MATMYNDKVVTFLAHRMPAHSMNMHPHTYYTKMDVAIKRMYSKLYSVKYSKKFN